RRGCRTASAALYARVRLFYALWHTRPRVQRASGIPCALSFEREATNLHHSGGIAPREGGSVRWIRRVGKATTSAVAQRVKAEACPPPQRWWARRKRSFAHPTTSRIL